MSVNHAKHFFLPLLFLLSSLSSAEILDHTMSHQERKKTGVSKLTDKEKAALQRWLDTHYEKRKSPLLQEGTDRHAVLQENMCHGQFIGLSDQTLWEIYPEDVPIAQGWITPVDIIVANRDSAEYGYQLTNSLTGSCLRAKKIEKLPPKPSQKIQQGDLIH
jgi:hypothetical protein